MDAYGALTELNSILRIFALHNINSNGELSLANWLYVKMTLLLACSGIMLGYNVYYHYCSDSLDLNQTVKAMDIISITFGFLLYVIDLYFVCKYAGESFIEYFEIYGEVDKYFEMKYQREIRRKVKYSAVMFLLLWFSSTAADYAIWCWSVDWLAPTLYLVAYFSFLMRILTVLELNAHSMLISYRLKTIADVLKDQFSLAKDMPSRVIAKSWPKILLKNKVKTVPLQVRETNEMARLGSYYLLLSKQAVFLNNFFGVRILLHCLYTLSETISLVNLIDRILTGSMKTINHIDYYPAMTVFLRLLICAFLLSSLVYHCEQSSRQLDHVIIAVDHLLVNKRMSTEDQKSLQQLRGLVSTRPIRFHAANFFNLDATLLLSTASVVATYAVLLIQTTV